MNNRYFRRIYREPDEARQLDIIVEACDHYGEAVSAAMAETRIPTGRIETTQARLAGVTANAFSEFQDLENILEYIGDIEKRKIIEKTRFYKENYPAALSDRTAEKYAEVDDGVQKVRRIRHYVSDARNQYLAVMKGLETLHYQITNITKMRVAGLDEASF